MDEARKLLGFAARIVLIRASITLGRLRTIRYRWRRLASAGAASAVARSSLMVIRQQDGATGSHLTVIWCFWRSSSFELYTLTV